MIVFDAFEVLFVDVDGVVLLHTSLHPRDKSLQCVLIIVVLLDLFAKSLNVGLLSKVDILGPTSFDVLHASILHDDAFGIHFRFAVDSVAWCPLQ